jgi:hypothetical protein
VDARGAAVPPSGSIHGSREQMYGTSGGGPPLPKSMFTRTGGIPSLAGVACRAQPRW